MTTPSNLFDLRTGLSIEPPNPTAHEQVGFELGWDYAHYRVCPPTPYADERSPLRDGLVAGAAAFGLRTLAANRHVRQWLQLRLHAWLRGRSVERVQVTPNYLQQIDASHCPITRVALSSAPLAAATAASMDRVRNDAGYAAGNLAVMSTKANHAKAGFGFRDAQRFARQSGAAHAAARTDASEPAGARADASAPVAARGPTGADVAPAGGFGGLDADQWHRVAILCSFVEPLPHDEACRLPLRLLPPNRLRLFNPVQALQAFVCHQLLKPGWSQRIGRFEALLPSPALRRDFKAFFMSLLPRVLEAGRSGEAVHARWAIEDAWRAATVQQRWERFALQLTAAECEALLARAAARRLGTAVLMRLTDAGATDGWNLASRGYLPNHASAETQAGAATARMGPAAAQQRLAW